MTISLKFQKTKLMSKKRLSHLRLKYQQVSILICIIFRYTLSFFLNIAVIFWSILLIFIMFLHWNSWQCFVPDIIVFGICSLSLLLSSIVFLVGVLILRKWVNNFQLISTLISLFKISSLLNRTLSIYVNWIDEVTVTEHYQFRYKYGLD